MSRGRHSRRERSRFPAKQEALCGALSQDPGIINWLSHLSAPKVHTFFQKNSDFNVTYFLDFQCYSATLLPKKEDNY